MRIAIGLSFIADVQPDEIARDTLEGSNHDMLRRLVRDAVTLMDKPTARLLYPISNPEITWSDGVDIEDDPLDSKELKYNKLV